MQKVILAVTGASGAVYGARVIEKLTGFSAGIDELAVIFSENGKRVWQYELNRDISFGFPAKLYDNADMFAPLASGSAGYTAMAIVPCSMGTLGRIASGTSNDLIVRAADVMLKERRKLILVPRELPYNLIHLKNMVTVTQAGAIVLPASPSFYSLPTSMEQLIDTVTDRIIEMLGFSIDHYQWGHENN